MRMRSWAISTIYNYLAVTGDAPLLNELIDYHTIDLSDESIIYPLGVEDSVLKHLLRIMDYLSRQRDPETGLVLALYGDWNDALDGLGVSSDSLTRFGTGVSVMPNSYVNNPQLNLTGQSMNDWQTGCSNVLLKLLVRYAFGFQPSMDGLRVSPAAWMPFDRFEFQAVVHGRIVKLLFEHADVTQREILLDGAPIANVAFDEMTSTLAATVPYESLMDDQLNVIQVYDPCID